MQIGQITFSNCSGSGAEISPEASLASKASMSRSFFLGEMQSKNLRKKHEYASKDKTKDKTKNRLQQKNTQQSDCKKDI